MFIIEISYNVLYVWHCMELYEKKFFINGNCMIRSFGQPGFSRVKEILRMLHGDLNSSFSKTKFSRVIESLRMLHGYLKSSLSKIKFSRLKVNLNLLHGHFLRSKLDPFQKF